MGTRLGQLLLAPSRTQKSTCKFNECYKPKCEQAHSTLGTEFEFLLNTNIAVSAETFAPWMLRESP